MYTCIYVYNYTFGLKQTFKSLADTCECGHAEERKVVASVNTFPHAFSHIRIAISSR